MVKPLMDECFVDKIAGLRPRDHDLREESIYSPGDGRTLRGIRVESYPALIQAVGYLKYVNRGKAPVYFRGQAKVYSAAAPIPSVFRPGPRDVRHLDNALATLGVGRSTFSQDAVSKSLPFHDVPKYAVEPLLQHYGLGTTWLDITDALPYALYFCLARYGDLTITKPFDASYDSTSGGSCASRVFRNVVVGKRPVPERTGNDVYLYAICPGARVRDGREDLPGLVAYEGGSVIDARVAVPSQYFRPHSQHGLLFRPNGAGEGDADFDFVVFVIDGSLVAEWLGAGAMFADENIYPPIRELRPSSKNPGCNPYCAVDRGLVSVEKWACGRFRSCSSLGEFEWIRHLVNYVTPGQLRADLEFISGCKTAGRLDWHVDADWLGEGMCHGA